MKTGLSTKAVPTAPRQYCDFSCPFADFGDPCTTGACRRDITVYCTVLRRFHTKHARCLLDPIHPTPDEDTP